MATRLNSPRLTALLPALLTMSAVAAFFGNEGHVPLVSLHTKQVSGPTALHLPPKASFGAGAGAAAAAAAAALQGFF